MNFRDRVQSIIAAEANPVAEAFEGFAGLRPRRVFPNEGESEREQAGKRDVRDTFLESFKRRSEYQFFRGKKSPLDEPDRGHSLPQTRLGEEPSKPAKGWHGIRPETVQAGVAREVGMLDAMGVTGPDADARAIAITKAKLRNSEVFAELQHDIGRCFVCGDPNDDTEAVIVVLTGKPGHHHHLHARCHPEHVRRIGDRVDEVMREAGYLEG